MKKILVIGAGPIIIGQACEFDYSGCQSCKTLKKEKFLVILLNSNPATIMTDYEIANIIYFENINLLNLIKIIEIEKPDYILPTMGGQTALNCIFNYFNINYFNKVKVLGITKKTLINAENRMFFYNLIKKIGLKCPEIIFLEKKKKYFFKNFFFPCIIRSSFSLGGLGSNISYNYKSLYIYLKQVFNFTNKVFIDKSILGWKEYELELLIDNYNNFIVICCIENLDPVGIHTGDSITVTPAYTISDKEYQNIRDISFLILKSIGLKGGGANVQFAINPANGDIMIIEMNPRVSRSAALASKATGYSISIVSTKIAIGYNLVNIFNDISYGKITSGFEPCIDYVVVKFPKFNFEKYFEFSFLNTMMKSIGEVMGISSSFKFAFLKSIFSLIEKKEIPNFIKNKYFNIYKNSLIKKILNINNNRIFYILDAFRLNFNIKIIFQISKIDPWYLFNIKEIINFEKKKKKILINSIKKIDSCSSEFVCPTPYFYSSNYYGSDNLNFKKKIIVILGSGANKIGQSIEFDYCCAKFSKFLKKIKYYSLIINCNPETVSTDYDSSSFLFFEPILNVYIKNILLRFKKKLIICQLGGQTSLNYYNNNNKKNVYQINNLSNYFGIKKKFNKLLFYLNIKKLKNYFCYNNNDIIFFYVILKKIILRLPNIIGGSMMQIIDSFKQLILYLKKPIKKKYVEKFINKAKEFDIDILVKNGALIQYFIVEHIDHTGVHSGDSNMIFPSFSINFVTKKKILYFISLFCYKIKANGIYNFQLCLKKKIYIIECNPRASRTIPFVSKCLKFSIIYNFALFVIGYNVIIKINKNNFYFIKKSIFPFNKFKIPKLSPEMKSTGETMYYGLSIQEVFFKSNIFNYSFFINFLPCFYILKYLKKNNIIIYTNNFFKKVFFDLNLNIIISNNIKKKNIIISKNFFLYNDNTYTNIMIIRFVFSVFNKKFNLIRKINKI